ncbi:MAG: apolipoprotein N-acyltransferase [Acidobacteriota bacterium]|jgi:apolipoprotein N-acyltransferase
MIFILPALTGILLAASFPRASQAYLAWVAFVPLILFLSRAKSVKGALGGGFIAGLLEYFPLLIWMPPVLTRYGGLSHALAWFAYLLLISVLSCYPAAACALTKYGHQRCGDAFILAFPFIWILSEYALSFSPFGGLPWLMAGYSQSRFLGIIQISDLTGVYGISFLLVWTGAGIALLLHRKARGILACAPAGIAIILISACCIYGRVELRKWGDLHPRSKAVMLQGNISFDDPDWVQRDKFQDGYVRMADALNASRADLLILPESPSPLNFESDSSYRRVLERLAGRFPLGLVFNNVSYRGTEQNRQYFNSAYFLDRNGTLEGLYDKIHLVPFGEYTPLKGALSFIDTISKDVDSFSPGDDYRVVTIGSHPANVIICFEAVFPRLVRRFVQRGSQLIINLTNDRWYGDSAAPYQHLEIARFRAVENRRYLLRAANSGISAFIEPTGRIQTSTGILRQAICEGHFDFIEADTLYTRYGDVFVLLCAIISCGLVIGAGLHKRFNS